LGCITKDQKEGKTKMIRKYKTLEANLVNGCAVKIEHEDGGIMLRLFWANGEEIEALEIYPDDLEILSNLFTTARGEK